MVTEERRPLFGQITGHSEAPANDGNAPRIALTELGQRVHDEWWGIPRYYPQIEILALQMMPDHLHGIIFIREQMEKDLSRVIRGFKTGCNRAYRELVISGGSSSGGSGNGSGGNVPFFATESQNTERATPRAKKDRYHGFLFAPGFNDRILLREGQLDRWVNYLHDNPRRLLMKREHPDLFRVQRGLTIGTQQFSAIGNRFLLDRPVKIQVQCSRRLTVEQIEAETTRLLALARKGAVLVSPSISPGEKHIMRAAFEEHLPLIILQENGFTDLAKPGGQRMEACARGQLLLLAPWQHHNEQTTISRQLCLSLNDMARMICI
jgi:hypothetical protein